MNKERFVGVSVACKLIGISRERLYSWEKLGIIIPKYEQDKFRKVRKYSEEEIRWAIMARQLIENEGCSLKIVAQKIREARK
ncbi:MAG: MerR family transcriptional regulator [Candidatus Aminicenantia bacterium]